MTELTMERLAALAMRGLSFYDLRRWGWTYAISSGGGRYGCTILYGGKVYITELSIIISWTTGMFLLMRQIKIPHQKTVLL